MHIITHQDIQNVDIIGDIHGCFDELIQLVEDLGYKKSPDLLYRHPKGRHLAFVGDLVDRGPHNRSCLFFGLRHHEAGVATYVMGNHENKLGRALKGNDVRIGAGLEMTLKELSDLSPEAKLKLSERILGLPMTALFDGGKLMVVHASPPDLSSTKSQVSKCLYGVTTGRTNEKGFPERVNWVPHYCNEATEDTPFVVFGHVTHKLVYITDHACCVDTACVFGNKLSAFSWPEHTIRSVESHQVLNEDVNLVLHDTKMIPTPLAHPRQEPGIDTFDLTEILTHLKDNTAEVLSLIDHDPLLNKRENDIGLIIANASKGLYEPKCRHQLYAKGIVYTRNPYQLVSLPLIKMHNHERNEKSHRTTQAMLKDPHVITRFPAKEDGTLIQVFAYEGEVYLTTRSVIEGSDLEDDLFVDYLGLARQILQDKYPKMLDDSYNKGFTFLFELIHPETHVVTHYHGKQDLILLAMYDQVGGFYLGRTVREAYAQLIELTMPYDYKPTTSNFEEALVELVGHLDSHQDIPEGIIVEFEKHAQVVHRVKVKTQTYLHLHRLRFMCTYKSVVNMLWDKPDHHAWEDFLQDLKDQGLTDEEAETSYKEYHNQFTQWYQDNLQRHQDAHAFLEDFNSSWGHSMDTPEYYKALAIHTKKANPEHMGLVMTLARKSELPLHVVLRTFPAYDGFKGVVDTSLLK